MCECANSAWKTKSSLATKYKSLMVRKTHMKAIVALAHKIIRLVYLLLTRKWPTTIPRLTKHLLGINCENRYGFHRNAQAGATDIHNLLSAGTYKAMSAKKERATLDQAIEIDREVAGHSAGIGQHVSSAATTRGRA